MWIDLLTATLVLSAPLLLAAMGGYTSERSGVINIGLEGKMLIAACLAAWVGLSFGAAAGLAAGIGGAVAFALLHWAVTQFCRVDHVVSGMAINALGLGITGFIARAAMDGPSRSMPRFPMFAYEVLALAIPIVLGVWAVRTRGGLRLTAVGADPDKARLMGLRPLTVRLFGQLATGLFCGLSGVALVTYTGTFTENMTAGKGFIALAALILGGWRPIPTAVACLGFGFLSALQIRLQGVPVLGVEIPTWGWSMLPYLVTIIALAGFLGKSKAPAGLGKP